MKKFILALGAFSLLPFFGVSTASQETGIVRGEDAHFTLSSLLYGGGQTVSLEVSADGVTAQGVREAFLSGSVDLASDFGLIGESLYFSKLRLPEGALRIREDGKRVSLDIDLWGIPDFRAFRRIGGGTLSEITDPSIFPAPSIHFVWDAGAPLPTFGGKIQSFYSRPDGEWTRSVITNLKREVRGSGEIFGLRSSDAGVQRFEYVEDASETSASSDAVSFPMIIFPSDSVSPVEP